MCHDSRNAPKIRKLPTFTRIARNSVKEPAKVVSATANVARPKQTTIRPMSKILSAFSKSWRRMVLTEDRLPIEEKPANTAGPTKIQICAEATGTLRSRTRPTRSILPVDVLGKLSQNSI